MLNYKLADLVFNNLEGDYLFLELFSMASSGNNQTIENANTSSSVNVPSVTEVGSRFGTRIDCATAGTQMVDITRLPKKLSGHFFKRSQ